MDFYQIANWFHTNRKRLIVGALVVFVIGSVVAIVIWHNDKTEADANAAIMALPSTFGANPNYVRASASSLEQIAKDYPGTPAGEHAEILAASVLFSDGKFADAEQAFKKFVTDHGTSPLVPQATMGIAAALEAQGKAQDAINKYQDIIGHYPTDNYITSPAKLTLARLFEEQNKPDQALKYYDELTRNPDQRDLFGNEARERREILMAKHPELNKSAVSSTMTTPGTMAAPAQGSSQPKVLQIPQPAAPAKK